MSAIGSDQIRFRHRSTRPERNIACFKRPGVLGCRARTRAVNRNWPSGEVVDGVIHSFPTAPRLIEDRRRGQSVDNPANVGPLIPGVAPTKAWRAEWTAGLTARAVLPRSVFHGLSTDAIPSVTKAAVGNAVPDQRRQIPDTPTEHHPFQSHRESRR